MLCFALASGQVVCCSSTFCFTKLLFITSACDERTTVFKRILYWHFVSKEREPFYLPRNSAVKQNTEELNLDNNNGIHTYIYTHTDTHTHTHTY